MQPPFLPAGFINPRTGSVVTCSHEQAAWCPLALFSHVGLLATYLVVMVLERDVVQW